MSMCVVVGGKKESEGQKNEERVGEGVNGA
jgi:hypothetical protein